MNCSQPVTYIIRKGDNLYQLSLFYKTNVKSILSLNPGIDPYNLQIGSTVLICPGEGFGGMNPVPPALKFPCPQLDLSNEMRKAWSQHVYWTRMFLISTVERLRDQNPVTARLMQNPADLATVFAGYFNPDAVKTIEKLLTEHLQIGGALITALRDGKAAAEVLKKQWYQNADMMADAFASVSPYFERGELRKMLYSHLDLTTREVLARLSGNYMADINAFDQVEKEALMMADYFTHGIMKQFPNKFI